MAVSLKAQIDHVAEKVSVQAAHLAILNVTIKCLLATTIPNREVLLALFEDAGPKFLERSLNSHLTDEAHSSAEQIYREFLKLLKSNPIS